MVAVHELAPFPAGIPGADLFLLQDPPEVGEVILVRCPCCQGLRSVSQRHASRYSGPCRACARGDVIPRSSFCSFWSERFSDEEIETMARAIWG